MTDSQTATEKQSDEPADLKEFGWVLLALMGYRKRVGRALEVSVSGTVMLRLDIPVSGNDEDYTSEIDGGAAIYGMQPFQMGWPVPTWSSVTEGRRH